MTEPSARRTERATPQAARRVVTAPLTSAAPRRAASTSSVTSRSGDLVETLYHHPSVKIVSFIASNPNRRASIGAGVLSSNDLDEPGSLAWSSQLERTLAVGPFRIYRAPGSVAFLSCGSALQPILPKSQCWCIDTEHSKFVLQIRRPQYWRIELPSLSPEDAQLAIQLREVFDKILLLEKTECPFKRAFTVVLPEPPQTPIKRKPWTPVRRESLPLIGSGLSTPSPVLLSSGRPPQSPLAKEPETPTQPESLCAEISQLKKEGSRSEVLFKGAVKSHEPIRAQTASETKPLEMPIQAEIVQNDNVPKPVCIIPSGPGGLSGNSSITPQLTVLTASPSKSVVEPSTTPGNNNEASPSESTDSFYSVQSWHSPLTPLPPSPPSSRPSSPHLFPYPHQDIIIPKRLTQERDISDSTVTPRAQTKFDVNSAEATINTPVGHSTAPSSPLEQKKDGFAEPIGSCQDNLVCEDSAAASSVSAVNRRPPRRRQNTSSVSFPRGPFSPLPPAANLFSPPPRAQTQMIRRPRLETIKRLPRAVVHKTVEILLSPPSHLVTLMLNVAARIAGGEWRGFLFGFGESGEEVNVQWNYEDESDYDWEDELEEDYHLARTGYTPSFERECFVRRDGQKGNEVEGDVKSLSWEVD